MTADHWGYLPEEDNGVVKGNVKLSIVSTEYEKTAKLCVDFNGVFV